MAIQIKKGNLAKYMTLVVMMLSALSPAGAASPDSPREDVFGRTTGSAPKATPQVRGGVSTVRINPSAPAPKAPHPRVSASSTAQEWFTAFDTYVAVYKPTDDDRFEMNKPFNQEVERVTQFCNTVSKIARNYRILAHSLKTLPIPVCMPESRRYRDQMVDWYNDSALVYEDMVRPRPAARTKEELNAMIQDITDRSANLKEQFETLQLKDTDLRRHYSVLPPKHDDALGDYTGHH